MKKINVVLILALVVLFVLATIVESGGYMEYLTKSYGDYLYCSRDGCVMRGDIDMNGNNLLNVTLINVTKADLTIIGKLNASGGITTPNITASDSTLEIFNNLALPDDGRLYMSTDKGQSLYYNTSDEVIIFQSSGLNGAIGAKGDLELYSNIGSNGSGEWEPWALLDQNGITFSAKGTGQYIKFMSKGVIDLIPGDESPNYIQLNAISTTPQISSTNLKDLKLIGASGTVVIDSNLNLDSLNVSNNLEVPTINITGTATFENITCTDGTCEIYSNLDLGDYDIKANSFNGSWNGSTNYIPYTGATQNVNLGANNFTINTNTLFVDANTGRVLIGLTSGYDPRIGLSVSGDFDLNHTATENDDHAMEIYVDAGGYGDVKGLDIFYKTGAISAGEIDEAILIDLDETSATGGDFIGIAILTTTGLANVYGLLFGAGVNPFAQFSGTLTDMDSANNSGVDNLSNFISNTDDHPIFVNDNDYVIIGDANKFEEIDFELNTSASLPGIKPTFEYSTGVNTWGTFTPIDGTAQMTRSGIIVWFDTDIPTWAVGAGNEYLIRINRTRNNLNTVPIENKVQISAVTVYKWNKDGDLVVRNINNTDLKVTGTATLENITCTNVNVTTSATINNLNVSGTINASVGKFDNITARLVNDVDFENITISGTEIIWEIII